MLNSTQWENTIDGMKIQSILKKYLSTHEESPFLKKWGDKYGRIIKGWDAQSGEPIIEYSPSYLQPFQMKHNIKDVPMDYIKK